MFILLTLKLYVYTFCYRQLTPEAEKAPQLHPHHHLLLNCIPHQKEIHNIQEILVLLGMTHLQEVW